MRGHVDKKTAMISSTSIDLPEHRKQVIEACYVAHPYTLLQTPQVVGRREELKLLTDWVTTNEQVPATTRLFWLLLLLDERPFLLVLDGLERILLAYSRMDAAHLSDDDLDERTGADIARYYGLPANVKETYLKKHRLRQCADLRAGTFLRRLTKVRRSRLLISTRLYPAELQTQSALPMPGCYPLFLKGLTDSDALTLWRAFIGGERSGTSEQLLPVFRAFDNHALLLRALAGEVGGIRPAPGDFDRWRKGNSEADSKV